MEGDHLGAPRPDERDLDGVALIVTLLQQLIYRSRIPLVLTVTDAVS
jgi:hypothetical protein